MIVSEWTLIIYCLPRCINDCYWLEVYGGQWFIMNDSYCINYILSYRIRRSLISKRSLSYLIKSPTLTIWGQHLMWINRVCPRSKIIDDKHVQNFRFLVIKHRPYKVADWRQILIGWKIKLVVQISCCLNCSLNLLTLQ